MRDQEALKTLSLPIQFSASMSAQFFEQVKGTDCVFEAIKDTSHFFPHSTTFPRSASKSAAISSWDQTSEALLHQGGHHLLLTKF